MKWLCLAAAVGLPLMMDAAESVAPGFPAWEGVEPKNHLGGVEIEPSDMRQRVTVVVEFEAEKAVEQLTPMTGLAGWANPFTGSNWELMEAQRRCIVVFSDRGKRSKAAQAGLEALYSTRMVGAYFNGRATAPIYHDVRFPGGPDAKGKYPMIYVMPPEGTTPVTNVFGDVKGIEIALAAARACCNADKRDWTPFTGVREPKYVKGIDKALAADKPLVPFLASARAGIKSKNPEQAEECQKVYDALVQGKSDLVWRIHAEILTSPTRAYCDIQRTMALYPAEKKRMMALLARFQELPEVPRLGRALALLLKYRGEAYVPKNAGEAKKTIAALLKAKKDIAPFKDSPRIGSQNAAMLIDAEIDHVVARLSAL